MSDYTWPEAYLPKVVKKVHGRKLSGFTIALEAWRRGLTITLLDDNFDTYSISDGEVEVKFHGSRCSLTPMTAVHLAKNKQSAKVKFQENKVPTPIGYCFYDENDIDKLYNFADEIGYPVVLKPMDGARGHGVFTNIDNREQLKETYYHIKNDLKYNNIILEKFVVGDDFRVFVVGDKVAGVIKRTPANIVGDGQHSIKELVDQKNIARSDNPFLSTALIKIDREVNDFIANAGFKLDSILEKGKLLFLRGKANASSGGDTLGVTNEFPDEVKKIAVAAMKSLTGFTHCGVDVLYDKASGVYNVIEINSRPQIGVNMYPSHGVGENIPKAIIDEYFPNSNVKSGLVENNYIFDFEGGTSLIKSGVAKKIILTPPHSNISARRCVKWYFSISDFYRKKNGDNFFYKLAKKHSISGFLKKNKESANLLVCGEKKNVDIFLAEISVSVTIDKSKVKNWVGVVTYGFFVK